ncbi:PIN domain-containing protein [Candidatus Pacearchaeota archaeon]|nr:PIN domain-containing protein [Candidatus Pacearchaeota archaeon]
MVVNKNTPTFYFDTTFINSLINKNKINSRIIKSLKKRKWRHYLSIFCIMEVLNLRQENLFFMNKMKSGIPGKKILQQRQERDLNSKELEMIQEKFVDKVLRPNRMDYGFFFLREGWLRSLVITRETNITSFDAIHLATALEAGCDILLTSDGHFIKEGNIYLEKVLKNKLRLCEPENINKLLVEKGHKEINLSSTPSKSNKKKK